MNTHLSWAIYSEVDESTEASKISQYFKISTELFFFFPKENPSQMVVEYQEK